MRPWRSVNRGAFPVLGLALLILSWGASPVRAEAGYDKGFFIKTDPFEAHFGIRVQTLFDTTRPDTFVFDSLLGHEQDTKNDNELNIRRFKFYGTGTIFKPSVKWKFQVDVERFKAGGGSAGNVRLEESYVEFTSRPWTQLRVGQFKVPYGYEKMTSSGKLNLVDRSIVHDFFGINQEPGIDLFGQSFSSKFRYDVAITTGLSDNKGFDTLNDTAANGGSDFRYMTRLLWAVLDPTMLDPNTMVEKEEGAISTPEKPQLALEISGMVNRNTIPLDTDPFLPKGAILPFAADVLGAASTSFPGTTTTQIGAWSSISQSRKAYDRRELELLAIYKYRRFSIEGQANIGTVDPVMRYLEAKDPNIQDLTYDNAGYRVQTGFFLLPGRLELAGRWAEVIREAKATFDAAPSVKEEIDRQELRAGVNWYFSKHDWKWQTDIGQIATQWKLNGHKIAVPDRNDFPGPPLGSGFDDKVIQHNTRKDYELRSQLQFQF